MNSKRYAKKFKKAQEREQKKYNKRVIKYQKKIINKALKDGLKHGKEEIRFSIAEKHLHVDVVDYYRKKGYEFEHLFYNSYYSSIYKIIIRELKNEN